MKLLAMDTTAKVSSVALLSEEKVLAEYTVNLSFTHSQTVMPMCENLLACCQIPLEDIDAFAVSTGPGSFTGLRIGLSAVKGMAYALNKPCISVSTLDALSRNAVGFDGVVCCVMDARCKQVYNALYQSTPDGTLEKLTEDRALLLDELAEELKSQKKNIILVGDGADLCYNEYQEHIPNIQLAPIHNRYQRASSVGLAALDKWKSGDTLSASDIIPHYLRLPQAERERKRQQEQQKAHASAQ